MKKHIHFKDYKLGTLNICNFFNFSLKCVLCLNPSITLFCCALQVPYVGSQLGPRQLSHVAKMTEAFASTF